MTLRFILRYGHQLEINHYFFLVQMTDIKVQLPPDNKWFKDMTKK